MTRAKKVRKYALTKRIIGARDARLKPTAKQEAKKAAADKKKADEEARRIPQEPTHLFFNANKGLGPPYSILVDTNFLSLSVRSKVDLLPGLMDLLYAKCEICITDCVMAELEKLGPRFRLALRLARDERWKRLTCDHSVYADDCLTERVRTQRVYLVGTNDKGLKQRLRKIPGVPIFSVARAKYVMERLPEVV